MISILLILSLIIFEVIRTLANPLIMSESKIREQMLRQFPIGTPMNTVINIVQNEKTWSDVSISYENGYRKNSVLGEKIGQKHISVYIGEYRTINDLYFITSVKVYFGFNEQSELIDIRVQKMTDSL